MIILLNFQLSFMIFVIFLGYVGDVLGMFRDDVGVILGSFRVFLGVF